MIIQVFNKLLKNGVVPLEIGELVISKDTQIILELSPEIMELLSIGVPDVLDESFFDRLESFNKS